MDYLTTYHAPIGLLTLASDGENLTGLWLAGQTYFGQGLSETQLTDANLPIFNQTKTWLTAYFSGQRPSCLSLPLAPRGSVFRKQVWRLLQDIPYGQVVTYGDLAKKVGLERAKPKMSSQAVGGAVGHNPISLIIPCHRVIGTNGHLTGYAGGLAVKRKLLTLEGIAE